MKIKLLAWKENETTNVSYINLSNTFLQQEFKFKIY